MISAPQMLGKALSLQNVEIQQSHIWKMLTLLILWK